MKHAPFIACLALAAFAFMPRKEVTKATGPVADFMVKVDAADRAEVKRFYGSLKGVTLRDAGKLIPNTIAWRAMYKNSLGVAFDQTPIKGKYAGLDAVIDAEIFKGVGLKPVALTASTEDAKKVYEVIAENCARVEAQCE